MKRFIIAASTLLLFVHVAVCQLIGSSNAAAAYPTTIGDALPANVRSQLEKQIQSMAALYVEYHVIYSGLIETNVAYFDLQRFYIANGNRAYSYDGNYVWRGDRAVYRNGSDVSLTKFAPNDTTDPSVYDLHWRFLYFDVAGINTPAYMFEINKFSSLTPLVLSLLKESESTRIERDGENFKVTVLVPDDFLASTRQTDPEQYRKRLDNGANKAEYIDRCVEQLKQLQALVPKRTISLLLDGQHGYAVAERMDWTAAGQRISETHVEKWQQFQDVGIWLPERSVTLFYTKGLTYSNFSNSPVNTNIIELNLAEFGKRNFNFDLTENPKYRKRGTIIGDRTLPEAISNGHNPVMVTVGADGKLLRDNAMIAANEMKGKSKILFRVFIVGLLVAPLLIFLLRRQSNLHK